MSGRGNTPARRWAAWAMQAVVCVCAALLALVAALQLTLFREGHLVHSMDAAGYPDSIAEAARANCDILAGNAGLPAGVLDPLITADEARTALVRRVDVIWHGTSEQPDTPFENAVAWLEDTMTRSTGVMWTPEDDLAYARLRASCEEVWRALTVAPFANVLNILNQYRRTAVTAGYLLAAFLAVGAALLVPLSRGWRELAYALNRAALGTALAALAAAAWMGVSAPWRGWMPVEDAASGLFYRWMAALPAALAACGLAIAAALWALALGAFSMAERAKKRRAGEDARRRQTPAPGAAAAVPEASGAEPAARRNLRRPADPPEPPPRSPAAGQDAGAGRRQSAAPGTGASPAPQPAPRRLNVNQAHTRPRRDADGGNR